MSHGESTDVASRKPFRVLALSGGGVRGRFQSDFLGYLEEELQKQQGDESYKLADQFDLVAGTSTGAIIATSVAVRVPMKSVSQLFELQGSQIFRRQFRFLGPFSSKPPYDNKELHKVLGDQLETKRLEDVESPFLVIPVSQINPIGFHVFSNVQSLPDYDQDRKLLLKDVVTASCSAPFFFDSFEPSSAHKRAFVDGGLWANDPAIVALMYCQKVVSIDDRPLRILSVGNGKRPQGYDADEYDQFTSVDLLAPLIDLMFGCQESASGDLCRSVLGDDGFKCVNCSLPKAIALDNAEAANKTLPPLARNVWSDEKDRVLEFLGL